MLKEIQLGQDGCSAHCGLLCLQYICDQECEHLSEFRNASTCLKLAPGKQYRFFTYITLYIHVCDCFREYRPMENVTFLENGTKVEAVNPKTYVFEPNMSRGSEDDLIRTVNIPAMVTLHLRYIYKHAQLHIQAYICMLLPVPI